MPELTPTTVPALLAAFFARTIAVLSAQIARFECTADPMGGVSLRSVDTLYELHARLAAQTMVAAHANESYKAWRRVEGPHVLAHCGWGEGREVGGSMGCGVGSGGCG